MPANRPAVLPTVALPGLPPTLAKANSLYETRPNEAAKTYRQFVADHQAAKEPATQDSVGAAEVRLGFLAAHLKDWGGARTAFLGAKTVKGTGGQGEFGTLSDEGAYQAAVCLSASGDKTGAEREFRDFLKDRPMSPLVNAAFKRLRALNGGDAKPEDQAQIDKDIAVKQKETRFLESVCGPKTIAYLLPSLGVKPSKDFREIAKLCGTGETGTSIFQMRTGLKALGIDSFAYRINRADLTKAPLPAILLSGTHYVALLKVEAKSATVYDTFAARQRTIPLPPLDDPDFSVQAIVFRRLKGVDSG